MKTELKLLYIKHKHYRSRGLWARTNKGLYRMLRKYGQKYKIFHYNNKLS